MKMRSSKGLSLTEVLIAAALLLLIAISLIPLFQRSVVSNLYGTEATQASTGGVRVGMETVHQSALGHVDFAVPATSDVLTQVPLALDTGALVEGEAQAALGDERWVPAPNWIGSQQLPTSPALAGRALWVRTGEFRNFAYADIHQGTISVTGAGIVTLGDPNFFDTPLSGSDTSWDIKGMTTKMETTRDDSPLGVGQILTISTFRSY